MGERERKRESERERERVKEKERERESGREREDNNKQPLECLFAPSTPTATTLWPNTIKLILTTSQLRADRDGH